MPNFGVEVTGLRETRKKFRGLPPDAKQELKARSNRIAQVVGDEASRRFQALGHQGPLVASTLRTRLGDTPTITVGGSARLGKNRKPAFKLLYGTEFGSNTYKQFHAAHTGQIGRALYPTIRSHTVWMIEQWRDAADTVADRFTSA